ncbi:MarR family winged helix-turn-helix transcriptional regulator [Actinoplanes sp. CA-030573]|uniref:MarR family winged helix-turn-helix transcriptional regulator n=1 Tax=Actinoplanes sp. CA-030573 TaxID=3239898 RepID=UPI003D8BDB06
MGAVETPRSGWAGGDPGAVTGWTLVRAHHAAARLFIETLGQAHLTPTQFGVLVQVATEPGQSQAELARRVLVTPQSIEELLASLERLGHISRTHRRRGTATTVQLTPSEWDALDRATPLVQRLNTPEALGLTPDESRRLNALLHKVLDATSR